MAYIGFVVVTLPIGNNPALWLWPGLVYLALIKINPSTALVCCVAYPLGAGVVLGASSLIGRVFPHLPQKWFPMVSVATLASLPVVGVLLYFVGRLTGLAYAG